MKRKKPVEHSRFNELYVSQSEAFGNIPVPVTRPRIPFRRHMTSKTDHLPIDPLTNRISAVGVIAYPPGIPIVMPGETFGDADGPGLKYIRSIVQRGETFPGFEKELEGAELTNGIYHIWALKQ